uniref:Uncharacterized protein n=1 Tax=Lepeophtheirus salmonis TaxID=72036 RepID=A0A0K2TQG1_LEPSM
MRYIIILNGWSPLSPGSSGTTTVNKYIKTFKVPNSITKDGNTLVFKKGNEHIAYLAMI